MLLSTLGFQLESVQSETPVLGKVENYTVRLKRPENGRKSNYGMAGALSVYLFIVSGILFMIVYKMTNDTDPDGSKKAAKKKAKEERRRR